MKCCIKNPQLGDWGGYWIELLECMVGRSRNGHYDGRTRGFRGTRHRAFKGRVRSYREHCGDRAYPHGSGDYTASGNSQKVRGKVKSGAVKVFCNKPLKKFPDCAII